MKDRRNRIARAVLLAACVAVPASGSAANRPTTTGPAGTMSIAERVRAYTAARRSLETRKGIPAFARKYGMKCSACHFSVPTLNSYGLAFKDNGYRMKNGTDDLRTREPGYWPVFAWVWKNYSLDADRVDGQTIQRRGGFADGAFAFGGLGSIGDKVSFRFMPIIYEDGLTLIDHGWIRYNQAFGTDWLNVKVGSADLDLPISAGREYNMGNSRFGVLYAYPVPGSVSRFSVLFPQPGVEIMGHDRGSRSRYSVNVFNTGGAPRAHCTFCAPGIFGRLTRRQDLSTGFVRSVQVGAFAAYATWPVGPDSSDLKGQRRFGGDVELLLGSDALPLRATVMAMTGSDDAALVPLGTRDHKYDAGMLQLEYLPALPLVFYGRLQAIRNRRQADPAHSTDFGDQDFQLLGVRHALELNSRFSWLLELTYWRQKIKRVGPAGTNVMHHELWLGTHVIF